MDEDKFSFLPEILPDLAHDTYCRTCFDSRIELALQSYDKIMERACNMNVFYKAQSKETRLLKRAEPVIRVVNCKDRDETILRLAFLAANANFNCIIDVDLISEKIRNGSYQKMIWQGTGIPAQLDAEKHKRK